MKLHGNKCGKNNVYCTIWRASEQQQQLAVKHLSACSRGNFMNSLLKFYEEEEDDDDGRTSLLTHFRLLLLLLHLYLNFLLMHVFI